MKVAFISGVFNVLHPGHLRLFKFAKQNSDKLIVGIESKLMIKENEIHDNKSRMEVISNCGWVDDVILVNNNLKKIIRKIKPDIIVKGSEFRNKKNPEEDYITNLKTKIIFSSGDSFKYASVETKNIKSINHNIISLDYDFLKRRNISTKKLNRIINNFKSIKVCIIGDIIIDKYQNTQTVGVSKEDPTVVVTPLSEEAFLGGAGIVASHAASLGSQATFISICGNDVHYEFIIKMLKKNKVRSKIIIDKSRSTTVKKRIISENKTLLRVNEFDENIISESIQNKILNYLKKNIFNIDLIVLSDFNYGCLPAKLVKKIIDLANKNSILVSGDSQISSQIGDITRFSNLNLMSQTEFEIRSSLRNNYDGLITISKKLYENTKNKNIFLKLGSEGLLINSFEKNSLDTDRINSLNSNPVDISGAGDSMLIVSSLALSLGATIWESAILGSLASAVQVSRLGNIPLSVNQIKKYL